MKNKFTIFEGKKKFVYNLSSDQLIYRFELMLFFPLSTYLTSPLTPRPPPPPNSAIRGIRCQDSVANISHVRTFFSSPMDSFECGQHLKGQCVTRKVLAFLTQGVSNQQSANSFSELGVAKIFASTCHVEKNRLCCLPTPPSQNRRAGDCRIGTFSSVYRAAMPVLFFCKNRQAGFSSLYSSAVGPLSLAQTTGTSPSSAIFKTSPSTQFLCADQQKLISIRAPFRNASLNKPSALNLS